MKYSLYGTIGAVGLIVLIIMFNLSSQNGLDTIITTFEWVTHYVLPWIALYWFIQFVKSNKR